MLENAQFAIVETADYDPIEVHALSDTVNTFAMQYFPVLTADQTQLIFTRRLGDQPQDDEDLVVSVNKTGQWTSPISLSDNINSDLNEGTCTISADGRTLIFTSCHGRQGYGSCDLFISYKTGNEWSAPKNMGLGINSSEWDSQPSLSADGRVLYFVSTRIGGYGKQDIWVSYLNSDGKWSRPANLGASINTSENEISPFIHPNGRTLYFSSNGHIGMGGFDIYSTNKTDAGYSKPQNFGYPVNNGKDQSSIFITADGKKGFYSNECGESAYSCSKLYWFDIPEKKQVNFRSTFITGRVLDSLTSEPLGATIDLYDVDKNEKILSVSSDSLTGEYLMILTEGANYALFVNKKKYLFKSESFQYQQQNNTNPIYRDIKLSKIQKNAKTELKNIFFEFDSDKLTEQSKSELQVIVGFMKENPEVKIRIEGHTDNIGSEEYNLELSKRRAKSVYSYLIEKNIPPNRLGFTGYGSKFPTYNTDNSILNSKNRRIEFLIL